MKVFDILDSFEILKEEEILEETRLSSEFSIGFELEGICDNKDNEDLFSPGYLPSYHSGSEASGGAKALLELLDEKLGIGNGKIERDGSVQPTNDTNVSGHAWGFEYGSPIIPFNPSNMNKIFKFLSELKDIGIKTNNTCGFHTHISFKDMTRNDAKWLLFSVANDDELLNELSYLNYTNDDGEKTSINFFTQPYATDSWFRELKVNGDIKDWEFEGNTSVKYLILRTHPDAGTLEWRGPRNFINNGENLDLIKTFIKKLWKLILKFAKIIDMNEYNGFKKQEVLEKFRLTGNFNTPTELSKLKNADEIVEMIFKKPQILISLKPSKLETLLDEKPNLVDPDSYRAIPRDEFIKCWDKIPSKNKELMIRKMSDIHSIRLLYYVNDYSKTYDVALTNIILKVRSSFLLNILGDNLTLESSEQLDEILNIKDLEFNKKLQIMLKNQHLMSVDNYKKLIKRDNYYIINKFKHIPVKIQRMLIRRNPYNIQYINNPDQSIIDELVKKYGNDINEYILGEI